jgi:hypothetical protein
MNCHSIVFSEENPVTLPGMGMCTGTVSYSPGFSGSYWEPPEEPEIEEVSLKDAFGTNLDSEMILENDVVYAALEAAVAAALEKEYEAEAEALAADYEAEAPF